MGRNKYNPECNYVQFVTIYNRKKNIFLPSLFTLFIHDIRIKLSNDFQNPWTYLLSKGVVFYYIIIYGTMQLHVIEYRTNKSEVEQMLSQKNIR